MLTLLTVLGILPNLGEFETKKAARLIRFWLISLDLQTALAAFTWSYLLTVGEQPSFFVIINIICVAIQLAMLVYAMIDHERQRALFNTKR